MLFYFEIIQLLVEETNMYYQQYLDTQDERWPLLLWCYGLRFVFVFGSYCADGARSKGCVERLLVSTRTVLLSLLWKHYETRQILSCT